MKNLNPYVQAQRLANATAAGTTDVVGTVIDMQGYQAAYVIAALGALTATQVTKLICEQSNDSAGTDPWVKIGETAAAADADGNKLLVLEINEPTKRYLRFTVDRGTANAVVDSLVALLHRASLNPTPQHATVSARALYSSPSAI